MRLSGKGTVEGFKQEHDRAYFHFLKGYPGCPEEQERQGWRQKGVCFQAGTAAQKALMVA